MAVRKIKDDVFSVGANHWDRRLFDEIIPLPDGTSYNAYLIFGSKKTALIDTVDPATENQLFANLKEFKDLKINYVISNHAEQDHSGTIPKILELFPEAKVITNKKCKELLMDLLHVAEDKFIEVQDNETLSLGGKTFQFIFTTWVHWPETMSTYLIEDKILFSCDFFGSHLATSELFVNDKARVYEAAKRYYAEIMMPFRSFIKGNIQKIEKLEIEIVAPSHGPIHKEPSFIINAYKDWISDSVKNAVLIPYVSMHGSTKIAVNYLVDKLIEKNINVIPFNITTGDIGELAINAVDAATIIIATPTVLAGPHPLAAFATIFLNAIKPKTKFVGIITSYAWGGVTADWIKSHLQNLKGEFLEPVLIKGLPKDADISTLDAFVDKVVEKHRAITIL
jgi:flavorubredoxin